MKIGFVSRIGEFPKKEWEREFQITKEKNLSHLELIINYPFFSPSAEESQIKKIKELSERYDVKLILHLLPNQYRLSKKQILQMGATKKDINGFLKNESYLKDKIFNIASQDKKVREFSIEEIRKTSELAKKINAKVITIHGGSFSSRENYQLHLKRTRKILEQLNYTLDIRLAIENLPTLGHFGNFPNELPIYAKDLIYLVSGLENIGICFDIGHANTIEDPVSFYDKIKKTNKIWNIHISDNKGDKDDHLLLGKGNIDFKKFFKELKIDKYKGYLSLELDTWCEPPEKMSKIERIKALRYIKNQIK